MTRRIQTYELLAEQEKRNNEKEKGISNKTSFIKQISILVALGVAAVIGKRFHKISSFSSDPKYKHIPTVPLKDKLKHSIGYFNLKPTRDREFGTGVFWNDKVTQPESLKNDSRVVYHHHNIKHTQFNKGVSVSEEDLNFKRIESNTLINYFKKITIKKSSQLDSRFMFFDQYLPPDYPQKIDNIQMEVVTKGQTINHLSINSINSLPPVIQKLIRCSRLNGYSENDLSTEISPWVTNLMKLNFQDHYLTVLKKHEIKNDGFQVKSAKYHEYFKPTQYDIVDPCNFSEKIRIENEIIIHFINLVIHSKIKILEKRINIFKDLVQKKFGIRQLSLAQEEQLIESSFLDDMNTSKFILLLKEEAKTHTQVELSKTIQKEIRTLKNKNAHFSEKITALNNIAYACKNFKTSK